jgi:hypothetical protein
MIDSSRFLILDTIRSLGANSNLHYQEIKLIECKFSNYYCEVVYREPSPLTDIVSFNIDYEKMYLYILKKVWDETDEQFRDRIFELYDLNNRTAVIQIKITNVDLIGRLESGHYSLINGHIYF